MNRSLFTLALLVSGTVAAPGQAPDWSASHPGWSGKSVYTPSAPTDSVYRPSSTGSPTGYPSPTITSYPSSVPSSVGNSSACAIAASLAASSTNADPALATPKIPAEVAFDCLNSIPFNQSAAEALVNSIDPYLNWQTTFEYLKDPPAEYAEKVQPAYDFLGTWAAIKANVSAGAYASEYEFGWTIYRAFQLAHDGHFVYYPDSVTLIFSFGRTTPLVSVSTDGKSAPQPYVYADVLAASYGNASFTPSPIVEIDGQNATEYLLVWSEYGSLQDPDALWNNLFYIPAQVSLGSAGTGTGTFSGGGRGRWPYPGETTTLTFANGTTVTNQNFANVLVPLDNITSGEDIYQEYFAVPPEAFQNGFEVAQSTLTSASTPTATAVTAATTIPAPGYPSPVVREMDNTNGGYFLDGAGYEDVAVLSVPSFVGDEVDEIAFQNVNSEFIALARAANKTKLIVDVSANGGGTILQGYDLFKQLFPSILPYGANRLRAHEALNLVGEQDSYLAGLAPRSLNDNQTFQDIESAVFNYRTDDDVNYEPFTSWAEKYGPHAYGPEPDNFTSLLRWNLSDVLTPDNSGGIYVSGYLNRSNVTVQPFARQDIIVVYDGYCASTCTIFSELMRQQGQVKTIALGGRPNLDVIQAVGGVKGVNDFPWDFILESIEEIYGASNASLQGYWNSTILAQYTQLPLYRATDYVVNARDGLRQGDLSQTPLQFRYEPADCRILYTPAMVVDETAVWKTVADTVWGGGDACVAGSNDFYGPAAKQQQQQQQQQQQHKVRRDMDYSQHYAALASVGSATAGRGDGLMPL